MAGMPEVAPLGVEIWLLLLLLLSSTIPILAQATLSRSRQKSFSCCKYARHFLSRGALRWFLSRVPKSTPTSVGTFVCLTLLIASPGSSTTTHSPQEVDESGRLLTGTTATAQVPRWDLSLAQSWREEVSMMLDTY